MNNEWKDNARCKGFNVSLFFEDYEEDIELRRMLVDLLNLPEFIEKPIIEKLKNLRGKEFSNEDMINKLEDIIFHSYANDYDQGFIAGNMREMNNNNVDFILNILEQYSKKFTINEYNNMLLIKNINNDVTQKINIKVNKMICLFDL